MSNHSGELFEFIAEFASRETPQPILNAAANRLMDTLGCALYGGSQEWTQMLVKTVSGSAGRSTAFGSATPLGAEAAALCNGTAAHGFELDDVITDALAHPGAVVIPAAFAVAEETDAAGLDLLKSIVAGYEMMGRLGRALGPEASGRGWHLTCVAGPAASAVAVGTLLGFNAGQLAQAVGVACASAGGNKAFSISGGMVKRLHAGLASRAGVLAARLVEQGFTGPSAALDGKFGLLEVIAGSHQKPEMLSGSLGERFEVVGTSVKIYPCCAVLQSTLEAVVKLRARHGFTAQDVSSIRVGSSKRAVEQNNERAPADVMAGQYSLPFCLSLALHEDPLDPRVYAKENLRNPRIIGFMDRITMQVSDRMEAAYPNSMGAAISVALSDGRVLHEEILDAHGTAAAPCSDLELRDKFKRLAALIIGLDAADEALAAIDRLKAGRARSLSRILDVPRTFAQTAM